jgi:hypothetical protein
MSLLIIFRNQLYPNRFRDILIDSICTGQGNKAILCSGFFQEKQPNIFSASLSTNLAISLKNNSIDITTIGVYNNLWKKQYVTFCQNLFNSGVKIDARYTSKFKWHAKIFILKKGNNPIFGIIGSSNMTSRSFGITNTFNYEADVVLWDKSNTKINSLCMNQVDSESKTHDIIYAEYNLKKSGNISQIHRLKELENDMNIKTLKSLDLN